MKKIGLSILSLKTKKEKIKVINEIIKNGINWIHYDFMDGKFVKNSTPKIKHFKKIIKKTNNHIADLHLMSLKPFNLIKKYQKYFDFISFHIESLSKKELDDIIKFFPTREKLGIAINPETIIDNDLLKILSHFKYVLIMSVKPGASGQKFQKSTLKKVKMLKEHFDSKLMIQIDGGVNEKNLFSIFESGINVAISGSYLVKNKHKITLKNVFTQI